MTLPPGDEDFRRGLDLFNRGHFFDAHEALEDAWRVSPGDRPAGERRRLHLQGIVQLAVAFHHQSKGNYVGARSVLERALRNLEGAESSFPDLDLDRLRAELEVWRRHFDLINDPAGASSGRDAGHHSHPALPRIMLRR